MVEIVITIETDKAPELLLGQSLLGGKVTALQLAKKKPVSVSDLSKKYGFSRPTIIEKLSAINQGTNGKMMFDPDQADALLKKVKSGAGRGRKN